MRIVLVAGSAAVFAGSLAAQTVELRLRDETTRQPIAGAIIRLLRHDSLIAQTLSNEVGFATLRGDIPGAYRVRIDRIGFTGFLSGTFQLESDRILRAEVPVTSSPLALPEVLVRAGKSPCDNRGKDQEIAARLWDEIRKALTANLLT